MLSKLKACSISSNDSPPIDPSLLGEPRPASVSFPLHLLPGRWRAWVEAASHPFGSADYLAHCLLGAVAGVCGAGVRAAVAVVRAYQLLLSPFAGGACRFTPSCSVYAIDALNQHGVWRGGREKAPTAICRKVALAKLATLKSTVSSRLSPAAKSNLRSSTIVRPSRSNSTRTV